MTAVCVGGGTSSAKPGVGASVALTVSSLAALLNNIPTPWAVPFAGYLGLIGYNISELCPNDPPAVPTITAADCLALLTYLDLPGHIAAVAKFNQLISAYAWYQLCQCDSGAQPTPPAPPSAPTGLPAINPPAVSPPYPTGQPCAVAQLVGDTPESVGYGTAGFNPIGGATTITLALTATGTPPTAGNFGFGIGAFTAARVFISQVVGFSLTPTGPIVAGSGAVPANTAYWAWSDAVTGGYDGTQHYEADLAFYCGTSPGGNDGPVPTPCPPDFITQGLLQQILDLVTLIQRQSVPFAYVPKTTHSALTGRGELSVQGLIGAKITITSAIAGTIGEELGDPGLLIGAGWINWGTASDGFASREFLNGVTTLSIPPIAGAYTRLGYSLAPGVVATIVELAREP